MKIIGINADKRKAIVEMTGEELELLTCRNSYNNRLSIHEAVGKSFDVGKQWKNLMRANTIISHLDVVRESYQKALEAVEALSLEKLEDLPKK